VGSIHCKWPQISSAGAVTGRRDAPGSAPPGAPIGASSSDARFSIAKYTASTAVSTCGSAEAQLARSSSSSSRATASSLRSAWRVSSRSRQPRGEQDFVHARARERCGALELASASAKRPSLDKKSPRTAGKSDSSRRGLRAERVHDLEACARPDAIPRPRRG